VPADVVRVVPASTLTPAELARLKGASTISVCLPARNEASTVGAICATIVEGCMAPGPSGEPPLVDELIVLDDGSIDATAAHAAAAGARVVRVDAVLPEAGSGRGKGNVLWKSLAVSSGDIVVWCDTDLTSLTAGYITRLVAPLLAEASISYVKGFYARPLDAQGQGGGRTTELVARPLLSRFFPPLATVRQPLGGESAGRRALLERLPFAEGYGIETGLLIDALRAAGVGAMAQVDLGVRAHRHRTLDQLSEQAAEIIALVLHRVGLDAAGRREDGDLPPLVKADGSVVPVDLTERPPIVEFESYRASHAR
jgi:glucosyl-3-phosphoglycerate synthase